MLFQGLCTRLILCKKDRLWLAPEQLRNQNYVPSWQADIYAFSIVLHEILHRQGPFNITAVPSVDVSFILDQIKQTTFSNGSAKLFRPKIVVIRKELK